MNPARKEAGTTKRQRRVGHGGDEIEDALVGVEEEEKLEEEEEEKLEEEEEEEASMVAET